MVRIIDALIGRIEAATRLDEPGYALGKAISRTTQVVGRPAKAVGDTLHGRFLGHPVHPLAVAIPIGTWSLAFGLDLLSAAGLLRDRAVPRLADLSLRTGSAGAALAIATGLADWQHLNGRDRRVGLVHGSINTASLALTLASIALRARGRLSAGRWLSGTAFLLSGSSSYLGAHLVYRRNAGADHADRSPEPRNFTPVLPLVELEENTPRRVAIWDETARREIGVALVRVGDRVHAMGARCSHAGGPLDQGWVLGGTLVCPWHGSRYDLETGRPTGGPSTCPQPRYQTRVRDGMVELKREQEPGDAAVTAETLAALPDDALSNDDVPTPAASEPAGPAPKATEVLTDHHDLIRRLFDRTLAIPGTDPQRHALMRTLAAELDIHEVAEDAIFYPAVAAVSEDVDVAHAEHGVLADTVAATLKLPTDSPEFEESLRALHAAFLHHAGSEEDSMFLHAERLSDPRLRDLGRQLDERLDRERTSRFRRTFRDLQLTLMETV